MKILLVAATKNEIELILSSFEEKNGFYKYKKHNIFILITGVGIASTAYSLGQCFCKENYDIAIQAGIAGAYEKNISLGQVFHVLSDRFLYFGSEDAEFITAAKLQLGVKEDVYYGTYNNMIPSLTTLKKAKAITSNTIHSDEENVEKIIAFYQPQLESMEGASFFYACKQSSIPCLQIKAISNYVTKRNKNNWNIALAQKNLKNTIIQIIDELQ
jgi:futalosine hydrolase